VFRNPDLAFQEAKLAFEAELIASGLTYSIVRPTAFFKSLSGQVARLKKGKPFLVFGDGTLTACKPISDRDLGTFIASCLHRPGAAERHSAHWRARARR
jgi:divinyl chlorophyllide a 8-vinyl-reductase